MVPSVATTQNGVQPAARSSAIARSSSSGRIRYSPSAGMRRRPRRPAPTTIAAFSIELCASALAYRRRGPIPGRPASPSSRASSPGTTWRAARRERSEEIEAVSVNMPSNEGGRPSIWRSQDTTTSSSSVDEGALRHIMTFELRPAESHSPRIPGPEATLGK